MDVLKGTGGTSRRAGPHHTGASRRWASGSRTNWTRPPGLLRWLDDAIAAPC